VKKIESQKTDANSKPLKDCTIVHCGELVLAKKAKKKHSKIIHVLNIGIKNKFWC